MGGFCVGKGLFLFVKIKFYLGVEEKREKGKTPNPQTQNRNPNPNTREENGKKREGQEKKEGGPSSPNKNLLTFRQAVAVKRAIAIAARVFS